MQELPAGGAMAAVFADEARVTARLSQFADRLAVAALNGPEETVVSGDAAALTAFLASMATASRAACWKCRTRFIHHGSTRCSMRSNGALVTSARATAHSASVEPDGRTIQLNLPDAHYCAVHAREPVQFAACVDTLRAEGITTLVEVGPHPTLLAFVGRTAPDASWSTVASLRKGRDDRREMLSGLAKLYVCGSAVQWESLTRGRPGRRVALPTLPIPVPRALLGVR